MRKTRKPPRASAAVLRALPSSCLLALLTALPVDAAELDAHAHEALPIDASLTLAEVVDRTVEKAPGYVELEARLAEANAWQDRGGSWVAGPPSLSVRYQSDRWGDDLGLQEIETGIQLALWKWGQRRSTRELGQRLQAEADAAPAALRWEIAGLIRQLLWTIVRADAELELLEESGALAARLAASVERRYELGDVARRDLLLAQSAELDVAARVAEARVISTDAERTYRSVSGLDRRPTVEAEALSARKAIETSHPALTLAMAAVERARVARSVVRESGLNSPTVLVGPRRERSVSGQDFEDSIGITVTVPFGGRSHVNTQVTQAGRAVAAEEARLRAKARELELAMHEAAHSLDAAVRNVERASRRAELANQGYEMGEIAYSRGEIGLVELLNLQAVYLDARRQALHFDVEVKLQTALYNQAVGVMP